MSASVTISNTFAAQAGPIPLSQLDANFTQLATAVNSTLNFTNYAVDSGAANAYAVSFASPATVSYTAGLTISFKAANANSGASTLNVNSLGTKSIVTPAGSALSSGAIASGQVATVVYDGTNFQLQSVVASGGSAGGSTTQVQFNSSGSLAGSANMTFDGTTLTAGGFTTGGNVTLSAGTANGAVYLNASKQVTSSSTFTVSGTTWTNTGSFVVGSPTGGDKGAGTINATGLYVNGVAVVSGSGPVSGPASSTDYGLALFNGTSGLSLRSMSGVGTSGQVLTSAGAGAYPTWNTPAAPGLSADPRTILTSKSVTYAAAPSLYGSLYLSATTQMIVTRNSTLTTYYATVYDSSTDTMGSPVTIASSISASPIGSVVGMTAISSTSVLIGYTDTSQNFKAVVLSISGTTITVGTASTTAITGGVNGAVTSDPAVLGSTYVFYIVTGTNTGTYLIACTVSGSTVTAGSMATVTSTNTNPLAYYPVVAYSSTTGFVGWQDSGTTTFQMVGFSVSGTTVTVSGTVVNTSVSGVQDTHTYFNLASGRIFYHWRNASNQGVYVLCSMSGSTLSVATYTETGYGIPGSYSILVVSSSLLISAYSSSNSYYTQVIRDNSGAIANSSQTNITSTGFTTFATGVNSLFSGSTIKALFYTSGSAGVGASASISIVSNTQSITYENGTVNSSFGVSGPDNSVVSGGVSRNLRSNGLYYYPTITGTSGTIYPANAANTIVKGYTTSGYYQNYVLSNYYTGNTRNDPTNSACQWLMLSSSPNSATVTLYRVQYT